eukprot:scaffold52172_cov48-Attheya_sp.AAC.1
MWHFPLSVLATLLTSGGVSGFASIAPPHLFASHLAASVSLASPATTPSFFFQSRIAEPRDVESVPAAALLLSSKFPDTKDAFVVQYRSIIGYLGEEKGPVLDLSLLKEIKIDDDGNWIKADAGVTVLALATELSKLKDPSLFHLKELFTALPANSQLSVVEAALDEKYDKFRKAIEEIHVVDKEGNISSKQLGDINEQEDIIVNIVLSPKLQKASGLESDKVLARWYYRIPTAPPIVEGFVVSDLPDFAKVMIFKCDGFNDEPCILVFVDGDKDIGLPTDEWDQMVVRTPEELWRIQNDISTEASFDVLTASGVLDVEASKMDPSFAQILEVFPSREEHLLVTIEKGKIIASYDAQYPPDVDEATRELFTFDDKVPRTLSQAARDKPRISMRGVAGAKLADPEKLETTIEGFKGEIYDSARTSMKDKRFQYATSSYDNMMNPSIIVYPLDEEDVALAVRFASTPDFEDARKTLARPSGRPYKVMGRGGGHQYCGVSCDNGALIISMDKFKKLDCKEVNLEGVTGPDGQPHTVTKELHIGTGVILKEFAEFNKKNGVTVPHGECPTVGIGGHSQTGGYGHIARNFGLCIDYVYGFTIVTTEGKIRTVNRDSTNEDDKDLYWAVLGGSPGAFGVTTNLIFHPLKDADYPNSTGWATGTLHTPEKMKAVLAILEKFINKAKDEDEDALAEGLDLMASLSSSCDNGFPLSVLKPSLILFELECRDKTDTKAYGQMNEIIEEYKKTVTRFAITPMFNGKKHYPLSTMSLGYTRKPPSVTKTGRENKRPYRKTTYGSKDKLKDGWSNAFANLLNDVAKTRNDVHCIFQIGVGGGALARLGKAKLNSISQRDVQLSSVIFDLFRGEDDESIKATDEFARRFEQDVVNKFQTASPKVMAQWASHGDLDMDKEEVWEKYYDKEETYTRLRQIKKDVDPDDVFHSRFTVRPATN